MKTGLLIQPRSFSNRVLILKLSSYPHSNLYFITEILRCQIKSTPQRALLLYYLISALNRLVSFGLFSE